MDIQADINWIKTELTTVTEPQLIEAIKQMLSYRKSVANRSYFSVSKSELKERAEASLISIEKGNTRSLTDFKNEVEHWKAQ